MKTFLVGLAILCSLFTLTSCEADVDLRTVIDLDKPIQITINDSTYNFDINNPKKYIQPKSLKWYSLKEFAQNNLTGWKPTPASYFCEIYLTQGDFRLLYTHQGQGVVIGFPNENGEPLQYAKKIKNGDLDFLYD